MDNPTTELDVLGDDLEQVIDVEVGNFRAGMTGDDSPLDEPQSNGEYVTTEQQAKAEVDRSNDLSERWKSDRESKLSQAETLKGEAAVLDRMIKGADANVQSILGEKSKTTAKGTK